MFTNSFTYNQSKKSGTSSAFPCRVRYIFSFLVTIVLSLLLHAQAIAQQKGYYQDPYLQNEQLVFASDNDLWMVNSVVLGDANTVNSAIRVTSKDGRESRPLLSTDGNSLAFIANYDGANQVYVMSIGRGPAKQVTFEFGSVKLHQWLDDEHLLYSTQSADGMHSSWELKRLNIDSLQVTAIPVSDAIEGTIVGDQLYFTQFGLQASGDNAHYYKGGAAGEIWSFDTDDNEEATKLTQNHSGSVRTPMVYQDRIFFISNENGLDNIWSMSQTGTNFTQHTTYDEFPVRSASLSNGQIVFQHGADIKRYDISADAVSNINLQLQSDFSALASKVIDKPMTYLNSANISNSGKRVIINARGKLAQSHAENHRLVSIPSNDDARLRSPVIDDENNLAYVISDESGEYEIWQYAIDGSAERKQLTKDGRVLRTGLWLSPNAKHLVNTEKVGTLWIYDVESGKNNLVLDNLSQGIGSLEFSADSRYLAISYTQRNELRSKVYLHDLQTSKGQFITTSKFASYSPSFSTEGDFLYFLSDRNFTPTPPSPWGDRNMGSAFDKRTNVYAYALKEDTAFPFSSPTELSEDKKQQPDDDKADDKDSDGKDDSQKSDIHWRGLQARQYQVPVPSGNYQTLVVTKANLFLLDRDNTLHAIKIDDSAELKKVTSGVSQVTFSGDKSTMLVQKGNRASAKLYVVPAKSSFPKDANQYAIDTKNWSFIINPATEWKGIFKDAWLMHRDSLYDENMRGVDWRASYQRYLPLVERITARQQLNDIFAQMMGELNSLHSQVRGGALERGEQTIRMASLGGIYKDTKNGVEISDIYRFDRDLLENAPPLAKPDVDVQIGDIIERVNGRDISSIAQLNMALLNQVNQPVLLELTRDSKLVKTVVVPGTSRQESRWRYQHWVEKNRAAVTSANSDIGYLHLYAMGRGDLANFAIEFYAQNDKPGLIIDVRRNRGGNIDSIIIEKLMRKAWSFWQQRNGETFTNMQNAYMGHIVVLADEFTYSDGETFTAAIKALNIAPVIGKQTAGAGVWLSGQNRLIDNGIARVAEFPVFAMDGRWITEATGIAPDMEVTNLPYATAQGTDAQLKAAIEYLNKRMLEQPMPKLEGEAFPDYRSGANDIR